jgi:hypothetical protein
MQFIYTEPQTEAERIIGGHHYINAIGKIEPGDDRKFAEFVEATAPPPITTIYIDSSGGDPTTAIEIGRLIRANGFSTSVGRFMINQTSSDDFIKDRELMGGNCFSAATLMFLGGRLRELPKQSKLGVHQFAFKNPSPHDVSSAQKLSAAIAKFTTDMGVSLYFVETSAAIGNKEILILNQDELLRLRVITGGQTEVLWSVQTRNELIYVRGERDSIFGHHKVMLCYTKNGDFLFWSVVEAQGREEQLTKLGLVEIIVNGEETIFDVSERSSRILVNGFVNIIVKISYEEAKTIAHSNSFGVRVRFSEEAQMFLGTGAVSTEGGQEQLISFFAVLSKRASGS